MTVLVRSTRKRGCKIPDVFYARRAARVTRINYIEWFCYGEGITFFFENAPFGGRRGFNEEGERVLRFVVYITMREFEIMWKT